MSQTVSRFQHPLDIVRQPQLEPEVKRAILASGPAEWLSIDAVRPL